MILAVMINFIYHHEFVHCFIKGRGPRIFRGRGIPMMGGPMGPMPGQMGPPLGGKIVYDHSNEI